VVNFDSTQYDGIPTGFTAEGYPYRGSPDAPVTIVEYSDYLCPFCKRHFDDALPGIMQESVRSGQVRYVFRDFPIAALHPTAPQGHAAAWCVGEDDAALYWKMHDLLFATREQWNSLPDPSAFLAQLAAQAGSDPAAYAACIESGRRNAVIDQGIADARAAGFNGTPSFQFVSTETGETYPLVGASPLATFTSWIEPMVAGEAPPVPTPQARELPYWATAEGLKPDPLRPGYTAAGDAYRGNPDATVVVAEFSDFQCPACASFVAETQSRLDQTYVDSGKVLWIFKHLPLRTHPQAPLAAAAAECAGDQGKFWDMHDRLYATIDTWAVPGADAALVQVAGEAGLDTDAFAACLNGRTALERVMNDLFDSFDVGRDTPAFVIIYNGAGEVLRGAQPFDQFAKSLDRALTEASATPEPQQ
jgi:protein-disulfide isomerase